MLSPLVLGVVAALVVLVLIVIVVVQIKGDKSSTGSRSGFESGAGSDPPTRQCLGSQSRATSSDSDTISDPACEHRSIFYNTDNGCGKGSKNCDDDGTNGFLTYYSDAGLRYRMRWDGKDLSVNVTTQTGYDLSTLGYPAGLSKNRDLYVLSQEAVKCPLAGDANILQIGTGSAQGILYLVRDIDSSATPPTLTMKPASWLATNEAQAHTDASKWLYQNSVISSPDGAYILSRNAQLVARSDTSTCNDPVNQWNFLPECPTPSNLWPRRGAERC